MRTVVSPSSRQEHPGLFGTFFSRSAERGPYRSQHFGPRVSVRGRAQLRASFRPRAKPRPIILQERIIGMTKKYLAVLTAFGVLSLTSPRDVRAFTLDTPVVFDSTHTAYCVIYNGSPASTCTLNPSTGAYPIPGLPPLVTTPASILTSSDLPPGSYVYSLPITFTSGGGMCHFDVSGCSARKVRAVLSFDDGPQVPAY